MNANGDEFGADRLIDVVAGARQADAKTVVASIASAVDAFREATPPNDDMTVVAVRITS